MNADVQKKQGKNGNETKQKTEASRDMAARRAEVAMRKKEEAQERRRISNMRREQALRNSEAKRKVRERNGGMGMTIVFYDVKPPRRPFGGILGRRKRK